MRRSSWILSGVGVFLAILAAVLVLQFGGGSTPGSTGTGGAPAATTSAGTGTGTTDDGKADGATNTTTGKPGENK
jgi:hypothetical protein